MASYYTILYKDIQRIKQDGSSVTVRLEIQKREGGVITLTQEIGKCLVGLDIEVGGNEGVTAAIVKSSCNIQLIDRPQEEWEPAKKSGGWEMFYTSDSTLYKVVIKQDGQVRWSGFITPDSYSEDISPYPVISVTARDMIGHLSDFDCDVTGDEYGMVTVYDLIRQGLSKVEIPMTLSQEDLSLMGQDDDGNITRLDNAKLNVEAFNEDSWYEAIEKVLNSFGLVMRYIDGNKVLIDTLEEFPKAMTAGEKDAIFVNVSGHRTLDPAYREIVDDVDWESGSIYKAENLQKSDFIPKSFTYNGISISDAADLKGWTTVGNMAVYNNYPDMLIKRGYFNQTSAIRLFAFNGDISVNSYIEKKVPIYQAGEISVRFSIDWPAGYATGEFSYMINVRTKKGYQFFAKQESGQELYTLSTVFTTIKISRPANPYPGAGVIPGISQDHEINVLMNAQLEDGDEFVSFSIRMYGFKIVQTVYRQLFVPIINLEIAPKDDVGGTTQKVRTIYNEKNNLKLDRNSYFTQGGYGSPKYVLNSVYSDKVPFFPLVNWYLSPYSSSEKLPFAGVVHKEILAYYSKPNNLLEGEFMTEDEDPRFDNVYLWGGKKHLLISGKMNMLTGRVQNAVLREFLYYSDLWN